MVCGLGRPSQRITVTVSCTAIGNGVVVSKALTPHYNN